VVPDPNLHRLAGLADADLDHARLRGPCGVPAGGRKGQKQSQ
jgi:hypothetical protein